MLTDWIMIIITTIYVIATIVICISNKRSADAAKEQTREMIKQYNENNRPYIIVKFEIVRLGLLCFVVENVGNMPAIGLEIDLCREFIDNIPDDQMRTRVIEFVESKEIYLAPNQKIYITLGGQGDFNEISNIVAKFVVHYSDRYENEYFIDLKQYRYMLTYESPEADIASYVKKMYESGESSNKEIIRCLKDLKIRDEDVV